MCFHYFEPWLFILYLYLLKNNIASTITNHKLFIFPIKIIIQTPEAKSVEELEFNDHNITTVTEGTGSILTINDTTFTPDQDKVRSFGMARINDIGSTTLHAAQELDDAMRVTLRCDYLLV